MKNLVLLGDSLGYPYGIETKVNTYAGMLARRLGLRYCPDCIPGTQSELLLYTLVTQTEIIDDIKNAEVILLSVGGNNIYPAILNAAVRACNMEDYGINGLFIYSDRTMKQPMFIPKLAVELKTKRHKELMKRWLDIFRPQLYRAIAKIKELSPNVVIILQTVYNPLENSMSPLALALNKDFTAPLKKINDTILSGAQSEGYLVFDFNTAIRNYKGDVPLTNFNAARFNFDPHLTEYGHEYCYLRYYEMLTAAYPSFIHEEVGEIKKTKETLEEYEQEIQTTIESCTAKHHMRIKREIENDTKIPSDPYLPEFNDYFIGSLGGRNNEPMGIIYAEPDADTDMASLTQGDWCIIDFNNGCALIDEYFKKIGAVIEGEGDYERFKSFIFGEFYIFSRIVKAEDGKIEVVYGAYGPKSEMT